MFYVFYQFFILGLYSFGGPAAHIGYFQRAFVKDKKWLKDEDFTHAVALCQFLPGPASSQLGMYIGFKKAGYRGAIAAFTGFTLPSFLLLTFLAIASNQYTDSTYIGNIISAAKLLAVIVVADALWGMAKKNLTSLQTIAIAILTMIWIFFSHGLLGQIVPIIIAAAIGFGLSFREAPSVSTEKPLKIRPNLPILLLFSVLLLGLPIINGSHELVNIFNVFYQAGSFVFGGGHVVLPLLKPMLAGMVEDNTFLSAYASAQLVPGPMFTMASYLGAAAYQVNPILGSLIATIAVFLPGSLLLFAFLPAWKALFSHRRLKNAVIYVNACVVGLLASAFISPVITSSILSISDIILVCLGLLLFKKYHCPVWMLAFILISYEIIKSIIIS